MYARLGDTALIFVPHEGNAADMLDLRPAGPAHADVWDAYIPRSDAELFRHAGPIVTTYADKRVSMRAQLPWQVERDRILLEEHWIWSAPKEGSATSTRVYRMKVGALAPESRSVPR